MVKYEDFQLDEHQIDAIKKMHQKLAIMGYIKEHGVEPSDISEYYTATEDELEVYRRAFYAQYAQNQPQQPNNEIWYTSNDGNIVEVNMEPISNTYTDGKGVMVFEYELMGVDSYAFYNCTNLTSIEIPSSVTYIGDGVFEGCGNLTSIEIPSSVDSIGEFAFYDCQSLTGITIPSSVTSIGEGAFYDCQSLTGITIPSSVTSIGEGAFGTCRSLTGITIPSSVTSIGEGAFAECNVLEIISFGGTVEQWNAITKGIDWNYNVPSTYVQCTDGQVQL